MEEFHYLKGFSNYGFTKDGRVFNHKTKRWLGENRKNSYATLHLRNDDDEVITEMKHRLVAKLFVGNESEENIIVNHLNGNKTDDSPKNLEWTTYQGNQEHAGELGLTEKCIPVSIRNVNTGDLLHFPSVIKTANYLGLTKDAILWRINGSEERIYPEGYQYRRRDDRRPWITSLETNFGRTVSTLLRDITTNEVREYDKQSDLALAVGCCLSTINISASSGDQRLINERYQVKLKSDNNPWRIIDDIYRDHGLKKAVLVINDETKEEKIYPSARACAETMGLLTTTLNERLNKNGSKVYNGFRFKRY